MPDRETIIGRATELATSSFFDQMGSPNTDVWEGKDYGVRFRLTREIDLPEGYKLPKLVLRIARDHGSTEKLIEDFVSAFGKPLERNYDSPIEDEQILWEISQEVLPEVSDRLCGNIRSLFREGEEEYAKGNIYSWSTTRTVLERISLRYPIFSENMKRLGEALGRAYSFYPKTGTEREMLKAVKAALSGVSELDENAKALLKRLLIARSFVGKNLRGSAYYVSTEAKAMMEEMGLQEEDASVLDFDRVITSILQGRLKLERQTS